MNVIQNGDGETGSCQSSNGVTTPTGWSVSGTMTQVVYGNSLISFQTLSTPGPRYVSSVFIKHRPKYSVFFSQVIVGTVTFLDKALQLQACGKLLT